ncbi:hypothetical protein SAMN06296386_109125 [Lachnospiraceae bacterium]|nr:hypothetical protein SAMN06296386_109125 [Lachnospiraceae bacterium]
MQEIPMTIDDCVFDFIFGMAVSDATNLGPNTKKDEKTDILENKKIKDEVKRYSDYILSNGAEGVGVSFEEAVANIKSNDDLSFGKIQKILNMTTKYLFIRYYDDESKKGFDKCHAPMDSIMRDFVYESYYIVQGKERKNSEKPGFKKDCSWSQVEKKEYDNYQKAIDQIIKSKKLNINRVEFDFMFWNQAKRLKNKTVSEQHEIIKKIWEEFDKKYLKY